MRRSRSDSRELRSFCAFLTALAEDRRHGAYWLAGNLYRRTRDLLRRSGERFAAWPPSVRSRLARAVERAQPAMGPFLALSEVLRRGTRATDGRPFRRIDGLAWIEHRLRQMAEERVCLPRRIARRLPIRARVVTFSHSELVERTLLEAHRIGRTIEVVAARSDPGAEGWRLGRRLRSAGIPVRFVRDLAAAEEVRSADLLLVGADAIYRDRSIAHKVGTRRLARVAHRAGVMVWVAAGPSKFVDRPPPRRAPSPLYDITPGRWLRLMERPSTTDRRPIR